MRAVEFAANRPQLPLLELAHSNAVPLIGRPDHRRVHELEHGPLAEGVRDDLVRRRSSRNKLEEIGGADDLPVSEREAQMGKVSKSSVKHWTTAGNSRPYVCTKSSRSSVASAGEAASNRARARIATSGRWGSGALLWRLRSRWTRQRWRRARGKRSRR